MAEKKLNVRLINKHDIEANWLKATNFIPKKAEIIVYDVDENHGYERFKIGDGETNVNDLPFQNAPLTQDPHMHLVTDKDGITVWEERTHWEDVTFETILDETELVVDTENMEAIDPNGSTLGLMEGNTYKVTWNGAEYECVANYLYDPDAGLGMMVIGNLSVIDASYENTNEPFIIVTVPDEMAAELGYYWAANCLDGSTAVTVSITGEVSSFHPIDARYFGNLKGQKKIVINVDFSSDSPTLNTVLPLKTIVDELKDMGCEEIQNTLEVIDENNGRHFSVGSVEKINEWPYGSSIQGVSEFLNIQFRFSTYAHDLDFTDREPYEYIGGMGHIKADSGEDEYFLDVLGDVIVPFTYKGKTDQDSGFVYFSHDKTDWLGNGVTQHFSRYSDEQVKEKLSLTDSDIVEKVTPLVGTCLNDAKKYVDEKLSSFSLEVDNEGNAIIF